MSIIERCKKCKKYLCDDKCKSRSNKEKIKCTCSGQVNTNNVQIDIFPNGREEGSRIVILDAIFSTFTATTINPPTCFTNPQGTYLSTGGNGFKYTGGILYEGSYGLVLEELTAGFNRFLISFVGVNAEGLPNAAVSGGIVPNGMMSITKCTNDCICQSFPSPSPGNLPPGLPPFTAMLNPAQFNSTMFDNLKNNTIRTVTLLPNGEVEINEDSI